MRSFLLLLLGLSAPLWVVGSLHDVALLPGLNLFQLPLGMPAVAALILTYRDKKKGGVLALLKRTWDVRSIRPAVWYLPILLTFPAIGLLDYLLARASGAPAPPPSPSLGALLGYLPVFLLTYGEELGLTGYAMDRLQERHGALWSGVLVGFIQAGYHLPGFVISGYYSTEWICWHLLYSTAARVLFAWVYNNAGRSMFAMALLHWTFGLFWILWPTANLQQAPAAYDPRIAASITATFAAIVVFAWGSKTLAQYRFVPAARPRSPPTSACW